VATDVTPRPDTLQGPAATHRRRAVLLWVVAAWMVWLWGTRLRNLIVDAEQFSAAFIGVHAALYVTSFVFAGALAVVGTRMWREARGSRGA
jgi:hypothetical protein